MMTFTEPCRTCDGKGRWHNYNQAGRYGVETCPSCKGSCEQPKLCECCDEIPAVNLIEGDALCADCTEVDDLAAMLVLSPVRDLGNGWMGVSY